MITTDIHYFAVVLVSSYYFGRICRQCHIIHKIVGIVSMIRLLTVNVVIYSWQD